MGGVWPRLPVGIRGTLLAPHPLHRCRPTIAAPSSSIVLHVRLTIRFGGWVDHERPVVYLDWDSAFFADLISGFVQANFCQPAPRSRNVRPYFDDHARRCGHSCRCGHVDGSSSWWVRKSLLCRNLELHMCGEGKPQLWLAGCRQLYWLSTAVASTSQGRSVKRRHSRSTVASYHRS